MINGSTSYYELSGCVFTFRHALKLYQQAQRFRAALPRSPVHPLLRAQNEAFRPLSFSVLGLGAGGFKLLPVAAL